MEGNNGSPLISNNPITRGQLDNDSSTASQLKVELSDVSESEIPPHSVANHGINNHRFNNSVEHDTHSNSSRGSNVDDEDVDLVSPKPQICQDHMRPVDLDEAVGQGYPSLDFRFITLKSWFLILSATVWLSILAGIAALTMMQLSRPGVLHIRQTGNYWAMRFTPGIGGTITGIWWRSIAQSYDRLFPYFRMANTLDLQSKEVAEALLDNNIVEASIIDRSTVRRLVRGRNWTIVSAKLSTIILGLFLVPFKSALLQITEDEAGWGITVSPEAAYIIMGLYASVLFSTLAVLIQLWGKPSGLKWNPCSVASQLALVHGSNIFEAFHGLEFSTWQDAQEIKWGWIKEYGCLRLGYWRDSQRMDENQKPEQLWYGIRFMKFDGMHMGKESARADRKDAQDSPSKRYHMLPQDVYGLEEAPITVLPGSRADWEPRSLRMLKPRSLTYHRYANGYANLFLNDFWISLCFLIGLASLVGFGAGLETGVLLRPNAYAGTYLEYSLVRGMVLSFLPGFILSLGIMVFMNSDTYHRMLQPIRGMDKPHLAEHNILIDYMSPNALQIIFDSLSRGHYRVAWGSFVAMNCTSGPILAGKMFTVDETSQTFQAAPLSAYSVLGILCLYIIALPLARVDPKYSASRGLLTIFDTMSLCYDSPMLEYPEFSVQRPDDEEIHLKSQVIMARRRYQFGYYLGLSGRRRLGFAEAGDVALPRDSSGGSSSGEAVGDPDSPMQAVDRIKTRYRFFRFFRLNGAWWFWRPRIVFGPPGPLRRGDTEMCVPTSDDDNNGNSGAIEMVLMHGALQDGYGTSEREGVVPLPGSERCDRGAQDGDVLTSRSTAICSVHFEAPSLAQQGTLVHD